MKLAIRVLLCFLLFVALFVWPFFLDFTQLKPYGVLHILSCISLLFGGLGIIAGITLFISRQHGITFYVAGIKTEWPKNKEKE